MDPDNALEIMKLLEKINSHGTTVIVATHAKDLVDSMKKRVITFVEGNLISDVEQGVYDYEVAQS